MYVDLAIHLNVIFCGVLFSCLLAGLIILFVVSVLRSEILTSSSKCIQVIIINRLLFGQSAQYSFSHQLIAFNTTLAYHYTFYITCNYNKSHFMNLCCDHMCFNCIVMMYQEIQHWKYHHLLSQGI